MNKKEYKILSFNITDFIEEKASDGTKSCRRVKGYASTYGNTDRVGDRIIAGAFAKSIAEYKSKNRQIKVYYNHDTYGSLPIGGIKADNVVDDNIGLNVTIDLADTSEANDIYALLKQGVLTDMSIGYSVLKDEYSKFDNARELIELKLWEVSIVGEPANELAQINEVKNVKFIDVTEAKTITSKRDLEKLLRESGVFSKEASTLISSKYVDFKEEAMADNDDNDQSNEGNLGEQDICSLSEKLSEIKKLLTKIRG